MSGEIYEVVSPIISGLIQTGDRNARGLCPLHGEVDEGKRPGFSIDLETGLWYCFRGCGGGTLPQLLRKLKTPESHVRRLEIRLERILKAPRPRPQVSRTLGVTGYPLPEWVLGLYTVEPTPLVEAGFDPGVLFDHDVGVDLERARITFPIRDARGNLAGISGRDLTGEAPDKYRVYEQEIRDLRFPDYRFHNRDLLYRLDRVFPAVMQVRNPTIVVCEGYKATLWVVQAGFPLVVGLMGSTPTTHQCWLLERMGGQILSFLDNDEAGQKGTAVLRHKVRGVRHVAVRYDDGVHQPDDYAAHDIHRILSPYYG